MRNTFPMTRRSTRTVMVNLSTAVPVRNRANIVNGLVKSTRIPFRVLGNWASPFTFSRGPKRPHRTPINKAKMMGDIKMFTNILATRRQARAALWALPVLDLPTCNKMRTQGTNKLLAMSALIARYGIKFSQTPATVEAAGGYNALMMGKPRAKSFDATTKKPNKVPSVILSPTSPLRMTPARKAKRNPAIFGRLHANTKPQETDPMFADTTVLNTSSGRAIFPM
mmetsp:Transcript_25904/g.67930  ORF Transcript_25904/g.67930 Transcript_25904/m.67930 type:complete len:225 (-) Transcript_25904:195-869(-)